jgi:hypothetical protein
MVLLLQIAFWGSLAMGCTGLITGHTWSAFGLLSAACLYICGFARALIRKSQGKISNPNWRTFEVAKRWDALAGPITGGATLILMFASLFGNRVNWKGNSYLVAADGRTVFVGRQVNGEAWPSRCQGMMPNADAISNQQVVEPQSQRHAA